MGEQHSRLCMPVCGTTCTLRWFPKGDPYLLLQVSVCRFSKYWIVQWLEFKHFSLLSRNSTTVISYEISITFNPNSLCPPFHLQLPYKYVRFQPPSFLNKQTLHKLTLPEKVFLFSWIPLDSSLRLYYCSKLMPLWISQMLLWDFCSLLNYLWLNLICTGVAFYFCFVLICSHLILKQHSIEIFYLNSPSKLPILPKLTVSKWWAPLQLLKNSFSLFFSCASLLLCQVKLGTAWLEGRESKSHQWLRWGELPLVREHHRNCDPGWPHQQDLQVLRQHEWQFLPQCDMGGASEWQQCAAAHTDQEGPKFHYLAGGHEHNHKREDHSADHQVEDEGGHWGGPSSTFGATGPAGGQDSAGAAPDPEPDGTHTPQRTSEAQCQRCPGPHVEAQAGATSSCDPS